MVDVSHKEITKRTASATGRIYIPRVAYELLIRDYPTLSETSRKGDTLTVSQLAAIMGAKKTSDLIPLCHPLPLSNVCVKLSVQTTSVEAVPEYYVLCEATVRTEGKTGVEMEALTAVSVGLLTVWDMLKAIGGKEMRITDIYVTHKAGGRSGEFRRESTM
jgi:GTP 3',8-cyclase